VTRLTQASPRLPRRPPGSILVAPRMNPRVVMVTVRMLTRAAIAVGMAASLAVWYACEARPTQSPTGPVATLPAPDFRRAALVQQAHTEALLATPGVIGTAVTRLPDGRA